MNRRHFLVNSLAATLAAQERRAGNIVHLLPAASHDRIQLRASFDEPQSRLWLRAGKRFVEGAQTDSAGLFWTFSVAGLQPATEYELEILSGRRALGEAWPLRTLPHPSEAISRFRLLIYTCAGGHQVLKNAKGEMQFLSLDRRRRLLKRALSFEPDAAIANGDHVYWDLLTVGAPSQGASPAGVAYAGTFDRTLPILGTPNEGVLLRAAGPQIASLYGTMFRSVPVFFLTDDHDHFDDDRADDRLVSMPPDVFMMRAVSATRRLYYPDFLPDANRPAGLAGSHAAGEGTAYGTLRYGNLAEILMYDCRRYLTLAGPSAGFVPRETEQWLKGRMASQDVAHVVNVPSVPIGWSAGKWGDWYPDILTEGRLGTERAKPFWQSGWLAQHDRLLQAASSMRERIPLFLCGDLHALAHARITRIGSVSLTENPVIAALAGPVSTSRTGWPSAARGTPPLPPRHIDSDVKLPPIENNGFTIVDFARDEIRMAFYAWDQTREADSAIDTLRVRYLVDLSRGRN